MLEVIKTEASAIRQMIEASSRVLLTLHPRADFDSVGSSLAMAEVLRGWGKACDVIRGDTALPDFAARVPGAENILPQTLGETDLSQYDLFLILDVRKLERLTELSPVSLPPDLKVAVIDHHEGEERPGQVNLVLPEAAATAEILYYLFREWGVTLSPLAAQGLLLGIYGDTGGFAYPATSALTFAAAGELIKSAPEFFKLYDAIRNNEDFDRIRFLGLGLTKAERFFGGKLIVSAISAAELAEKQIPLSVTAGSGLVSTLRGAAGALAAITLLEEKPGQPLKLSARSRDGEICDVARLAAQFGGGGHQAAAGALIPGLSLTQAIEEVKKVFAAQLDVD